MITFANVGVYLVPAGYIRDYRTAGSLVIMRPGSLKSMSANAVADLGSSAESGIRSKIRIVVADDHPIFRDGLCKLLGVEEDLEVVAQAENGLEVLGVLQRFEPDILLLDLRMPGLDGLATLERLEMAPTKDADRAGLLLLGETPERRPALGGHVDACSGCGPPWALLPLLRLRDYDQINHLGSL